MIVTLYFSKLFLKYDNVPRVFSYFIFRFCSLNCFVSDQFYFFLGLSPTSSPWKSGLQIFKRKKKKYKLLHCQCAVPNKCVQNSKVGFFLAQILVLQKKGNHSLLISFVKLKSCLYLGEKTRG